MLGGYSLASDGLNRDDVNECEGINKESSSVISSVNQIALTLVKYFSWQTPLSKCRYGPVIHLIIYIDYNCTIVI